jgi:hypothetical protein
MLSAPSHVLPPVTTLCSKFLHSLLISKEPDRYEQLFNVQIHSLTPSSQTISFSAAEREMGIRGESLPRASNLIWRDLVVICSLVSCTISLPMFY